MLNTSMATSLEDVPHTDEIGVDVGSGILQGIANTGLGCQMDDSIKRIGLEQPLDRCAVRDIDRIEDESIALSQSLETILFQLNGVVAIEVIDTDNAITSGEKPLGQVITDEARCPSDQDRSHEGNYFSLRNGRLIRVP